MTRAEFINNITTIDQLVDFCREEDLDACEDIYDPAQRDDYIYDTITEMNWKDIITYLEGMPDGYDWYEVDNFGGFRPLNAADFERYKQKVLNEADNYGDVWEDQEEEEEEIEQIFLVVEEQPEFPGGMAKLMKYFSDNVRYPVVAAENGIQGRVICQFTVWRDGSIRDIVVVRGVDKSLDKEAVRLIENMPKWKPGKQRGKPVRVKYTVPVNFRLQ